MPLTGSLSARYGSKPIIVIGGLGLAVLLPLLPIANSSLTLGLSLFLFGASLGSIETKSGDHSGTAAGSW
jgi:MFS family permease